MKGEELDDEAFFRALDASGARALLIGRRALILLGAPVITADFDLWLHFDDVERLNAAFEPLGAYANHSPEEARARGRYVLENGERIDVLIARGRTRKTTPAGESLDFESAWARHQTVQVADGLVVRIPAIADLIVTKKWASRPKDIVDIQFLELLRDSSR